MPRLSTVVRLLGPLLCAAMLALGGRPDPARAQGIADLLNGYSDTNYNILSTKTTDQSGRTTRTDINSYVEQVNLAVNYYILPKLNLDAGVVYYKDLTHPSGDGANGDTTLSRFQPFGWLKLQDPMWDAAAGYSLQEETLKASGQPDHTLSRATYASYVNWRPSDLPMTQFRFTRTITEDDPKSLFDKTEDYLYLKEEYIAGGLDAYYLGTYLRTDDRIRNVDSTLTTHEARATYTRSFFDERVVLATDNRLRYTDLENNLAGSTNLENLTQLPLSATGLSGLTLTPLNVTLAPNSALTDGNTTVSAGINLGSSVPPTPPNVNIGLDLLAPTTVSTLNVWVDWGPTPPTLSQDVINSFSWDIYTSGDNLTWTFHTTVSPAAFGPFDRRFQINFAPVTARYVKAVTAPLSPAVIGASSFPNIFVTELQAFVSLTSQTSQGKNERITQLGQNYNLDLKVILFRSPLIYYRFYGQYLETETDIGSVKTDQTSYLLQNGLYYSQRFNPIFSASANGVYEVGEQRNNLAQQQTQTQTGALYYASLAATPLPTLTDTLVFSGNRQWLGRTSTTTDTLGVYNTAQLYRGLLFLLNPAVTWSSADDGVSSPLHRRDYLVNVGTTVSPNPALTLTTYYTGKLSHTTGGPAGTTQGDATQNILDLSASFTPFRSLTLSSTANINSQTGQRTLTIYTYALSWAPFPDGQLQFNFSYSESHLPNTSRIIQPTLRWYVTPRRRSYLEATYQYNTTESESLKTQSNLFSVTFKTYYR